MFVLSQKDAIRFRENLDPGSLAYLRLSEHLLLTKTGDQIRLSEDAAKVIGQSEPSIYNHLERLL